MKIYIQLLGTLIVALSITSCGGGGGGTSTPPITIPPAVSKNVALASNGATILASPTSGDENFLIDGDTTTTNFWEASVDGGYVTIQFDDTYTLNNVTIRTANMTSNTYFTMEYSSNGVDFTSLPLFGGGGCINLTFGSGNVDCGINATASHFRLTIVLNSANIDVYDIEVTGS